MDMDGLPDFSWRFGDLIVSCQHVNSGIDQSHKLFSVFADFPSMTLIKIPNKQISAVHRK